jgi:hypothetical protein
MVGPAEPGHDHLPIGMTRVVQDLIHQVRFDGSRFDGDHAPAHQQLCNIGLAE